MDINIIYNEILSKLTEHGHPEKVTDLQNLLASASTGSEALGTTGKYLKDLKGINTPVYNSIHTLVEEYLDYCAKNGIIIE